MVKPRHKKLRILGIGKSEGTNNQTIEAPIIVVKTFEELDRRSVEIKGKIVVYNFHFESYGLQAKFRRFGASRAARHGAVAAFIRSVTPLSINSPHTGGQSKIIIIFDSFGYFDQIHSIFANSRRIGSQCDYSCCEHHRGGFRIVPTIDRSKR